MYTKKIDYVIEQLLYIFQRDCCDREIAPQCKIKDIINQVLVVLCMYAYQQSLDKYPLSKHLGVTDWNTISEDDAEFNRLRMVYQRVITYCQNKDSSYYGRLNAKDTFIFKQSVPELKSIHDRFSGYELNKFQFWEFSNISTMKLVKNVVDRKICSKDFTMDRLIEMVEDYEKQKKQLLKLEDKCFSFCALFVIEEKYCFEFIKNIVNEMIKKSKSSVDSIATPISYFCAPANIPMSIIPTCDREENIIIPNRSLILRNNYVESILNLNYTELCKLCFNYHSIQSVIHYLENCYFDGIHIKQWFAENTNKEDWLSVFNNYGLFNLNYSVDLNNLKTNKLIKKNLF